MGYILLTEFESIGYTSCKIKGLSKLEITNLEKTCTERQISFSSKNEEYFEADTDAVQMLNQLENIYKVVGQSMVIEKSYIGGRTVLVHKIVWTLQN